MEILTPRRATISFGTMLKESFRRWNLHEVPRLSAALSYYTAFSLAPLLILTIAIVGLVFGHEAARGQVVDQISRFVGWQSAETIQNMIQAASKPTSGKVATVISVLSLFIGASGVLMELKSVLNLIWGAHETGGFRAIIKQRLLSFAMVLAVGFLLLVSLIISALMAAAGKFIGGLLPAPEPVLHLINGVIPFGIITFLFAMIYRLLPDTTIQWADVWTGAAVTSFLFTVGKFALGIYIGKASVSSSYGAAGSILGVLLWVYYSAIILYFGAEFTKVNAERRLATEIQRPGRYPAISPKVLSSRHQSNGDPAKENHRDLHSAYR